MSHLIQSRMWFQSSKSQKVYLCLRAGWKMDDAGAWQPCDVELLEYLKTETRTITHDEMQQLLTRGDLVIVAKPEM